MGRRSRHERLFAALLRMFPSEFRGDFGEQMKADFDDQRSDTVTAGRLAIARLWLRTAWDFLRRGPREHMDVFLRDAAYGVRLLRRNPGFAATALLTLAIGIGLNTAVFSVVHGVLIRRLPFPHSDRLVRIFDVSPAPEHEPGAVSAANFADWAAQTRTLDALGIFGGRSGTLVGQGEPEWVYAMRVSEGLLDMLGTRPALGRLFTPSDYEPLKPAMRSGNPDRAGARPRAAAIILSHDLWQRQFHGRADIVGSILRFDRHPVEVVGVMPRDFAFTDMGWSLAAEAWVPDVPDPADGRRARFHHAVGRLAPGASLKDAQAEFDLIAARLGREYPRANEGRGVLVSSLFDVTVTDARKLLLLLFGAAACVLLIGCANVANLLLAHASGRRLELATRLAIGASRAHLIRQTVTEGLVLGAMAGAAGFVMAWTAVPWLLRLAPPNIPRLNEISIDGGVLAFSCLLTFVVGAGCGLAGCLSLSTVSINRLARSAGADARGSGGRLFRQTLTVAEITLALLLVIAAGLLVRTMRAVGAIELGFDPKNVISVGIGGQSARFAGAAWGQFDSELLARVRAHSRRDPGRRRYATARRRDGHSAPAA